MLAARLFRVGRDGVLPDKSAGNHSASCRDTQDRGPAGKTAALESVRSRAGEVCNAFLAAPSFRHRQQGDQVAHLPVVPGRSGGREFALAPFGPRSRILSSRRMRFRGANTPPLSCASMHALVPARLRVIGRASSWTWRDIIPVQFELDMSHRATSWIVSRMWWK